MVGNATQSAYSAGSDSVSETLATLALIGVYFPRFWQLSSYSQSKVQNWSLCVCESARVGSWTENEVVDSRVGNMIKLNTKI